MYRILIAVVAVAALVVGVAALTVALTRPTGVSRACLDELAKEARNEAAGKILQFSYAYREC